MSGPNSELGFAPGQTLTGNILFEGANTGPRFVKLNRIDETLTIGPTGAIKTAPGFAGTGLVGENSFFNPFGGNMTLVNQGLISSETSGGTVSIVSAGFTNSGTAQAISGGMLHVASTAFTNFGIARATGGGTLNRTQRCVIG